MPKLNMESLLPFIEEAFNRGLDFRIPITGTSMNPLLYQNRDFVKIVKPVLPLKLGDIPLYRRNNGAFVLHRVVGIKENGEYIMCGDNQFLLEHGITDKNIIGIVKTLIIDGREIDVDTDARYLKHKEKYLKNLNTRYPARRLRYKLSSVKRRVLKCGMRNEECENSDRKNAPNNVGYGLDRTEKDNETVRSGQDPPLRKNNVWYGLDRTETKNNVGDGLDRTETKNNVGDGLDRHADNQDVTQNILETGKILISAIKSYITGIDFEFPEDTDFRRLFSLSQSHRVTAMVAPAVMKSQFSDGQVKGAFSKELFKTSARYTAQERERQELSEELSKQKIKHCFLKGSKVGAYYSNPDCRFMLDMDLYVEAEKYQQAEKILVERGYKISTNADDKDTGYIKKPFLIVELHRELKYDYDKGYDYYKGAFERMNSTDGFAMSMTDEDFYVYILSHTAHHFETAGTGIKSLVDHYFLRENLKPKCNPAVLESSLKEIGLNKFSENIDKLCDFWFKDGTSDSLTDEMSRYIILSGVFGNETNSYLSGIIRGEYGNTADSYFIRRLFPPLKTMKYRYSVLKKMPVLLPVFWCVRIITSLINPRRIFNETKTVMNADNSKKEKQKYFFENIGL